MCWDELGIFGPFVSWIIIYAHASVCMREREPQSLLYTCVQSVALGVVVAAAVALVTATATFKPNGGGSSEGGSGSAATSFAAVRESRRS